MGPWNDPAQGLRPPVWQWHVPRTRAVPVSVLTAVVISVTWPSDPGARAAHEGGAVVDRDIADRADGQNGSNAIPVNCTGWHVCRFHRQGRFPGISNIFGTPDGGDNSVSALRFGQCVETA